ncbi:MAG: SDR family NAD(P)-dependent oxidoreductase, partial [Planctomycetota bacterium]
HNMTEEDWDRVLAVHLKGAFCVTQPAYRVMRQNSYGRIVFTTSAAGLFGNDDGLCEELEEAGRSTAEVAWPLPILPPHAEAMKSRYADLRNSGGRWGGACTAAAFLRHFVGEVPWAHLDIAGPAYRGQSKGYLRRGASGFGVRLLVEFLARRS